MTRRAASKPADGGKAKAAKTAHAAEGAANTNINVEHMAEVGAAWEDIMMCLAFSAFFVWVLSQDTSARIEKIRKVSSYSKNRNDIIMKPKTLSVYLQLLRHNQFRGLVNQQPLDLKSGGTVAPIDYAVMKQKMQQGEEYVCGINAAWVSWSWTITPAIPVNRTGVTQTSINLRFVFVTTCVWINWMNDLLKNNLNLLSWLLLFFVVLSGEVHDDVDLQGSNTPQNWFGAWWDVIHAWRTQRITSQILSGGRAPLLCVGDSTRHLGGKECRCLASVLACLKSHVHETCFPRWDLLASRTGQRDHWWKVWLSLLHNSSLVHICPHVVCCFCVSSFELVLPVMLSWRHLISRCFWSLGQFCCGDAV